MTVKSTHEYPDSFARFYDVIYHQLRDGVDNDFFLNEVRKCMHILEKENQVIALNNVCRHLKPGGRFIFDTFVPDLNLLINGLDNQIDYNGNALNASSKDFIVECEK
jgi:SAM-dependent methyltransferase